MCPGLPCKTTRLALLGALLLMRHPDTAWADMLGRVWYEQEAGGWTGVWTRIGASNEFDARFTHPSGRTISGRLRVAVNGHDVSIYRRNQGAGGACQYSGTFSPDFSTVSGTYACVRQDGSWTPGYRWRATILGGADAGAAAGRTATGGGGSSVVPVGVTVSGGAVQEPVRVFGPHPRNAGEGIFGRLL